MILITIITAVAFGFVAYVLGKGLLEDLKEGSLLIPVATTICSVTISYYLWRTGVSVYIAASFVGFFAASVSQCYCKKKAAAKRPSRKRDPKKVNP